MYSGLSLGQVWAGNNRISREHDILVAAGASGGPVPEPDSGGAHVTREHDIFLLQERLTAAADIGPNDEPCSQHGLGAKVTRSTATALVWIRGRQRERA